MTQNQKTRSDAFEFKLPDEHAAQLRLWLKEGLSYREAAQRLAALGYEISHTAVGAFWRRCCQEAGTERYEALDALAHDVNAACQRDLACAAHSLVHQRALEVAMHSNPPPGQMREIVGLSVRLAAQDLQRQRVRIEQQRLDLQRERFEFAAAEALLKHLAELRDAGLLESERPLTKEQINAVRRIMFPDRQTLPD